MNQTKDFYQTLEDVGVHPTRIPSIIAALNGLHIALSQLDTSALRKLKQKFNSLDDLFEASQTDKKITFKKPRSASIYTPRK